MRELILPAITPEVANALDFISNSVEEFGISDKALIRDAMLATEESLVRLLEHTDKDSEMEIGVKRNLFGDIVIELNMPGRQFEFYKNMKWCRPIELEDNEKAGAEEMIRGTLLTGLDGDIQYGFKKNRNTVHIVIKD